MKTNVPAKKNGAILVIVMAVLVALSLMVVALLQLGRFNQIETTRQLRMTQAHWLAEAGLERGLSRVMGSKTYRNGVLDDFSNDETLLDGLGSYEVEITRVNINTVLDTYTITSTGTVSNNAMVITNTVKLTFEGGPGGQQAIIALGGISTISAIAANTTIDGTIYVEGTLNIANGNVAITDIVKAGATNGNSGAATQGDLPDPDVLLDKTPYSNALYTASSYTNANWIFDDLNDLTNNLVNGTNYVNGSLLIKMNIPTDRIIVVTGTVEVPDAGVTIGSRTRIVAGGDVTFKNRVTLEAQTEIFSRSDIVFQTQGNAGADSIANGATLLALGDIETKNIDFNGIIYAEGRVNVTSGSDVNGTIIAGKGFDIAANVDVKYDPSVFAVPNPINYGNGLAIQPNTWQWAEAPF